MLKQKADIVVLGGGCAGLNFAMAHACSQSHLSLVVLESRENYHHDRNWSFWLEDQRKFDHRDILRGSWKSWRISDKRSAVIVQGHKSAYVTIASGDFYRKAEAVCERDSRIDLCKGISVDAVENVSFRKVAQECFKISTPAGEIVSQYVIDTRPEKKLHPRDLSQFYQIFFGCEIQAQGSFFDPDTLGLMDDLTHEHGGVSFLYTLPFSKKEALIEYTLFTPEFTPPVTLKTNLDAKLKEKLKDASYEITATEQAVLPMGKLNSNSLNRVFFDHPNYIGVGGAHGALRESSGYGFLRLYDWAKRAADAMEKTHMLFGFPQDKTVQKFLDRHFIKVLKTYPEHAPKIFVELARNTSGDRFADFMSGKNFFKSTLSVINAVPKKPFLKAFVR